MHLHLLKLQVLGLLAGLLALAVWRDLASFRIPNRVVFGGMAAGLGLHAVQGGFDGALLSLGGLATGLALMLPLYLVRAAGAGDAKLMAMVGAFLGPTDAVAAAIATFLAGMILALVAMARPAVFATAGRNLRLLFWGAFARLAGAQGPRFDSPTQTAARLPYSVAIAAGTLGWMTCKAWLLTL
jgi:prepilin peptidase CpaA